MSWFDFLGTNNTDPSSYNLGNIGTGNVVQSVNTGSSNLPQTTDTGLGLNLESLGGIGGLANILAGLGNTWNGFQQQNLAKKTLNFQKDAFNRTFANNNKVYNQNMEDVLRARSAQTGNNYDNIIAERRL